MQFKQPEFLNHPESYREVDRDYYLTPKASLQDFLSFVDYFTALEDEEFALSRAFDCLDANPRYLRLYLHYDRGPSRLLREKLSPEVYEDYDDTLPHWGRSSCIPTRQDWNNVQSAENLIRRYLNKKEGISKGALLWTLENLHFVIEPSLFSLSQEEFESSLLLKDGTLNKKYIRPVLVYTLEDSYILR